jgi:Phasin protein
LGQFDLRNGTSQPMLGLDHIAGRGAEPRSVMMVDLTGNGAKEGRHQPVSPSGGLQAIMEMQRPAAQTMLKVNCRLYDGMIEINKEWTSFVNGRLKEDLAVPRQLAACKSMQDMLGVYAEYVERACSQYQSGFEQMAKLGRAMAEDTVNAVRLHPDELAKKDRN